MLGIISGGIILFVGETAGEYFIKPHHEVDFWAGFWIGVISCLGSMTVNLIF